MRLNDLKPRPGAKHRIKRLGCGESSGLGKTCGRGHKGQKSRSGGGVRIGFEGGQMPIFRRLPKKGFSNVRFAKVYATANVSDLETRFDDGATIDEQALRDAGLISGRYDRVKILGNGELTKKLTVVADKVSKSAVEKIEKAGGSVSLIDHSPREKGVKAPGNEDKAKSKAKAKPAPAAAKPKAEPKPEPVEAAPAAAPVSEEAPAETESSEKDLGQVYESAPDQVDDLKVISGVGPGIEEKLNGFGIYTYAQVAAWNEKNIAAFDELLSFKGRIERDDWIKQATDLEAAKNAE